LSAASDLIPASLLPPERLVFKSGRWQVNLEDPVFRRILKAGDGAAGFWVSGEAIFSPSELRGVTHFELVNRSIAKETEKDLAANDAVAERTAMFNAGGQGPIRLLAGLSLTQIRLKPNMVGSIGEFTAEYVLGAAVTQAFRKARFTGFSLLPVTNPRTGLAYKEYFQIFSEAILAPANIDCSVQPIPMPDDDDFLRHLGCLSYDSSALLDRPDFNRTAEPWCGGRGWPAWVVTARVMKTFKDSKLRGWHFRPVLTTESDLYSEYLAHWRNLRKTVGDTAKSSMGARW
jgi:hypothetical protein